MPHLTIESSANLDSRIDVDRLCREALRALRSTALFEPGAPRVRAVRCEHYAIADEAPENAFVDISLRLGAGRSKAERRDAGELIFSALAAHLGALFETPHFALSLEIREIDPALSWKRNTMHERLRAQSAPPR